MIRRTFQLALVGAIAFAVSAQSHAQITTTFTGGGGSSNWSDTANWDTGALPGSASGDVTKIGALGNSGVTADFDLGSATIHDLRIGDGVGGGASADGALNVNAGTLTANNWTIVGVDADTATTGTLSVGGSGAFTSNFLFTGVGGTTGNNTGIVNISGNAAVTTLDGMRFGTNVGGIGITTQTGGSVTAGSSIIVAENDGAQGTYDQSAGTVASGDFIVGNDGAGTVGTYNLSGGSATTAAAFIVGNTGGADGTLNITGGSIQSDSHLIVGGSNGATGTVNQSAGTVNANNWVTVGDINGGNGTYDLSGGTLTSNDLTVGQNGAGTVGEFTLSGSGAVTVNNLFAGRGQDFANDGVANDAGSEGTLNLIGSGGTFTVNADAYFAGNSGINSDTTGILNFIADTGGVTTLDVAGQLFLNDGTEFGGTSGSFLTVDLTQDAGFSGFGNPGTTIEYLLVDNLNNLTLGEFVGLSEGSSISIGGGKTGILSYLGGDGNDIVVLLEAVPEPSSLLVVSLGLVGLVARRRRQS